MLETTSHSSLRTNTFTCGRVCRFAKGLSTFPEQKIPPGKGKETAATQAN